MSEFRILDVVLRLFPDVTAAVEEYNQIRSDRESRSIARSLANEEALYTQFARKIWLLSQSSSQSGRNLDQRSLDRLGAGTTDFILNGLREMEELLRNLKADLHNFSVSTEVLDKLRPRGNSPQVTRKNARKTPFMRRLDELSKLNSSLVARVLDSQMPLPFPDETHPLLTSHSFFHQDRDKPVKMFSVIHAARGPGGQEADAAVMRCRCQTCNPRFGKPELRGDEWDFEVFLLLEPKDNGFSGRALTSISNDKSDQSDGPAVQTPSVSRQGIAHASPGDKTTMFVPFSLGDLNGQSDKLLQPENTNRVFVSLGDLMGRHNVLDHRKRMELAFRLSSAVLQLSSTPWADGLWTLDDWFVAADSEREDEALSLFVRRKLHSPQDSTKTSLKDPAWQIIAREPVLARLGIHLTELALGRGILEIRREEPSLLRDDDSKIFNPELLSLLTVRRLLTLRVITQRVSANFQDVVSACINQQYRDRRQAGIKELDTRDPAFPERASTAILAPLYQEVRKCLGYNVRVRTRGSTRTDGRVSFNQKDQNIWDTEKQARKLTLSPADKQHGQGGGLPVSQPPPNHQPVSNGRGEDMDVDHTGPEDTCMEPAAPPLPDNRAQRSEMSECGHSSVLVPVPSEESAKLSRNTPLSESTEGQLIDDVSQSTEAERYIKPPLVDSDDASDYSYGTYTESTYSAFAWLQQPPKLPSNHPFLRFREVALQFVLGRFHVWTGAGNASGAVGQLVPMTQGESSKKRTRNGAGKGVDQGFDEEDDDNDDMKGPQSARKKARGENQGPTFACPFLKKDPIAHQGCCIFVLSRIRDVKQHLRRRHQMPIYCPRCVQIFDNEDDRDNHVVDIDCPRRPGKPDGITERQKKALSEKAPSSQTPETQWFGIFRILFPDHETMPQSPYMDMDSAFFRSSVMYQQFVLEQGPQLIGDLLTSRGTVTWNIPHENRDRNALLQQILHDGLRTLFDRYLHEGHGASTDSPPYPANRERTQDSDISRRAERETTLEAGSVPYSAMDVISEHSHSLHSYTYSTTTERSDNAYVMSGLNAILHDVTEGGYAHVNGEVDFSWIDPGL